MIAFPYSAESESIIDRGHGQKKNRRRQRVFDTYGGCCVYCGVNIAKPGRFTLDHVIPKSRGGDNAIENLRPSCNDCNQTKADRTPAEWAADIMRSVERPRRPLLASIAAGLMAAVLFWR